MTASGPENIRLHQKLGLVAFGLFLTFLVLEATLRLGGFIILSRQAHRNALAMRQQGVYRIMCIGESTTQGQYPTLLEQALNGRNMGIRFSVIDRGLVATNTSVLLSRMEADLDTYHPNMVVAMMGINDHGPHMPYEPETRSNIVRFMRTLRTYKLARIAWLHLASMGRRAGKVPYGAVVGKAEVVSGDVHKIGGVVDGGIRRGTEFVAAKRSEEAQEAIKKALEINPRNDGDYVGLAEVYRRQGKFAEAAEANQKALEINPRNDGAYAGLRAVYLAQGKFAGAAEACKKALEINPRNDGAYVGLGEVYRVQGKLLRASVCGQNFRLSTEA